MGWRGWILAGLLSTAFAAVGAPAKPASPRGAWAGEETRQLVAASDVLL